VTVEKRGAQKERREFPQKGGGGKRNHVSGTSSMRGGTDSSGDKKR